MLLRFEHFSAPDRAEPEGTDESNRGYQLLIHMGEMEGIPNDRGGS